MSKLLRRLLLIPAIVLVAYLVGGNWFLNSRQAHDWANRKPDRFQMSWSRAVTWFPGMIIGWDVRMSGHARRVVWQANGDRVSGSINLVSLLRRELRSASILATNVSLSADLVDDVLLPPPYRQNAWILSFGSIRSSDIRRLRFDKFEMEPQGSVDIAFTKQLRGGPFELLPSSVHFHDTNLRYGELALFSGATIDADAAIPKHRHDQAPGLRKLEITRATLAVDGVVPALGFRLDDGNRWKGLFGGGNGDARIHGKVGLADAKLQPGSIVEINAPLAGSVENTPFTDVASLRGELIGDDAKFTLHLPPPPQGSGSADSEIAVANARIDPPRELTALLHRSSGYFDMDWHFDALDWLDQVLVESPWLDLRGAGDIAAKLRLERGVLQEGSTVDIPHANLGVVIARHRFFGSASAKARIAAPTKSDGKVPGQLKVDVALDKFDIAASAAPTDSLVRGTNLQLDLLASSDLAEFGKTTDAHLRFKQAEMPDIRAFNRYLPSRSVVLLGGSTRLDGDVDLNAAGRVAKADVQVVGSKTRARLGAINLAGNFDLAGHLVASKSGADRYVVSGSRMKVTNLRVGDGDYSDGTSTWATLDLDRGTIIAAEPWTIEADAKVTMEDIRLLLGLFTKHREFPKWVIKLADAGVLHVSGLMRSHGDTLIFDRVQASNDRFDAAARMRVEAGKARGDLLLHWGVLSLGLEVDGDQHDFHMVRARHWYESQPDLLPASTGKPGAGSSK